MGTDIRYALWKRICKSKEPPPYWKRKRRNAWEWLCALLGSKKKRSTQSLSIQDF